MRRLAVLQFLWVQLYGGDHPAGRSSDRLAGDLCPGLCRLSSADATRDRLHNLYHAIDRLNEPSLKWLDLRALAEGLLRPNEVLAQVKYFSAFATWRPSHRKHRTYVSVLEASGVEINMGKFKEKPRRCPSCNHKWVTHEEKETDVHIAVQMVADALSRQADRLILISADTDLSPPIKTIARLAPACEVLVATPPGRFAICRALRPRLEITAARLRRALLPNRVPIGSDRHVECPPDWKLASA